MKKILFILLFAVAVLIQYQTSEAKEMKEWTFLVFMNGHNSLDRFTDQNLNSMQQVGSTDDINIVVQAASYERQQTERIYVEKGSHQVVEKLPRVDMGDYKQLKAFIAWAVEKYPAKKYFIDVWNHGSGWHSIRSVNPQNPKAEDVSFDDISNNFITTEQMGDVMKYFADLIGHKVDLYGNDACLMSMIEIVGELSDSVAYFASSQDNEPGDGWPYAKLLEKWAAKPNVDGGDVAKILTEEYYKQYQDNEGATMAALNLNNLDDLMSALSNFRNDLMGLSANDKKSVKVLAHTVHSFYNTDYKDLYDFVSKVEKANVGLNKSTLADLKKSYKKVVIKNKVSAGSEGAHGVSVWIPTTSSQYEKFISRYRNLVFNKKTDWADFLDTFFTE